MYKFEYKIDNPEIPSYNEHVIFADNSADTNTGRIDNFFNFCKRCAYAIGFTPQVVEETFGHDKNEWDE